MENSLGCFTVLHYGNSDVTKRCVDSLLKLNRINECKILILDNDLRFDYKEEFDKLYSSCENIHTFKSKSNWGFTEANNFLYTEAKKFNPKFIVVLNNDIEILQKDFIGLLIEKIKLDKYYVIGPDIFKPSTLDHQSPLEDKPYDLKKIDSEVYPGLINIIDGQTISKNQVILNNLYISFYKYCPKFLLKV